MYTGLEQRRNCFLLLDTERSPWKPQSGSKYGLGTETSLRRAHHWLCDPAGERSRPGSVGFVGPRARPKPFRFSPPCELWIGTRAFLKSEIFARVVHNCEVMILVLRMALIPDSIAHDAMRLRRSRWPGAGFRGVLPSSQRFRRFLAWPENPGDRLVSSGRRRLLHLREAVLAFGGCDERNARGRVRKMRSSDRPKPESRFYS